MTITFAEAIKRFFTNYANFRGRATRAEYWWAQLFIFMMLIALFILAAVIALGNVNYFFILLSLPILFLIGTIVPQLSLTVRRFHDVRLSGWWFIGPLIANLLIGILLLSLLEPFFNNLIEVYYGNATSLNIKSFINIPVLIVGYAEIFLRNGLNIFCIIVGVMPSVKGNKYGPNPYME